MKNSEVTMGERNTTWIAADDGGRWEIEADTIDKACAKAEEGTRGAYDSEDETYWVNIRVWHSCEETEPCDVCGDYRLERRIKVAIDPEEPRCADGHEHDWSDDIRLVGGIKENPGVWGHGGGVTIKTVCLHCGCARIKDTDNPLRAGYCPRCFPSCRNHPQLRAMGAPDGEHTAMAPKREGPHYPVPVAR